MTAALIIMSISTEEVFRIARLARLALNEDEAQATQAKLNGIFELIAQMQSVNTHDIEPMTHPREVMEPLSQRLRADSVSENNQREALLAISPMTEAGLFLVPKVIE